MLKSIQFLIASFAFTTCNVAHAASLDVDTTRLVKIEGEVGANTIAQGEALIKLARANKRPIYVSINSVGGSVLAGLQFVDAMRAAASMGVQVKCFVPNIAMSMAFYIFSECTERYAMKYSLLLFHPMAVTLEGSYNATQLADLSKSLTMLEKPLIEEMLRQTDLPRALFMYHYKNQTIWTSENLLQRSPEFLNVVDDFGAATTFGGGK